MFKNLGELFALVSVAIQSLSNLMNAGERQTQIILEASEFDVDKKRVELASELTTFRAEQELKQVGLEPVVKAA